MRTPSGEVTVDLDVAASPEHGTVDWRMTFPDHSVARAFSRVVEFKRMRVDSMACAQSTTAFPRTCLVCLVVRSMKVITCVPGDTSCPGRTWRSPTVPSAGEAMTV